MSSKQLDRIVICYLPAMDLRRVNRDTCSYISGLLDSFPWVEIHTLPAVDHVPTLLTGTYPHEHGVWGPKLNLNKANRGRISRLFARLPDLVTTTAQGLYHLVRQPMELAMIPPRRRARFEILRFKFIKYPVDNDVVLPINGMASIFTVVGSERCKYIYEGQLDGLNRLPDKLASSARTIEMVEVHALDEVQHWMLDAADKVAESYRRVDNFVEELHTKCLRNGYGFLVLCDHGMEPVIGTIGLMESLKSLRLTDEEFDFYIENTRATFWLHTERARKTILELLASLDHGIVVPRGELSRFQIHFQNSDYGDVYFYAEPGYIFYHNDFYQPIANVALSLLDRQQRCRLWNPRHRGDHGYFPEHACERGFMILADKDFTTSLESAVLIDFAPSVLALLGQESPDSMNGRPVFA